MQSSTMPAHIQRRAGPTTPEGHAAILAVNTLAPYLLTAIIQRPAAAPAASHCRVAAPRGATTCGSLSCRSALSLPEVHEVRGHADGGRTPAAPTSTRPPPLGSGSRIEFICEQACDLIHHWPASRDDTTHAGDREPGWKADASSRVSMARTCAQKMRACVRWTKNVAGPP